MTGRDETTQSTQPLAGLRVLEIGSIVAGPYCGRLLADFGAEVIKLEAPAGDRLRGLGHSYRGKSLFWASIHRNKRVISIDLKSDDGRAILRRLMLKCDAVIENLAPFTLEKWGLGYEAIAIEHPGLVMVRISGYGQTGPYADRPGYGVVGEAFSGLRNIIGDPDRPPARVALPLTDYLTGVHAAYGAMVALLHRERTGRGQVVDTALYEAAFSLMENFVPAYEKLGFLPERAGARLPGSAPNNLYPTADGKYIHITASNDSIFGRLLKVMGNPPLPPDTDFHDDAWRRSHVDTVDDFVRAWTIRYDLQTVHKMLLANKIPAAPINTMTEIFQDPQFRARNMLVDVPDDEIGTVTLGGVVPHLTETPGAIRWSGRAKGADTRAVLAEYLGMSDAELDRLEGARVILTHDD